MAERTGKNEPFPNVSVRPNVRRFWMPNVRFRPKLENPVSVNHCKILMLGFVNSTPRSEADSHVCRMGVSLLISYHFVINHSVQWRLNTIFARSADFLTEMVSLREGERDGGGGAAGENNHGGITLICFLAGRMVLLPARPIIVTGNHLIVSRRKKKNGKVGARTNKLDSTQNHCISAPSFTLSHFLPARMPQLTLSFKESLYREILNGRASAR